MKVRALIVLLALLTPQVWGVSHPTTYTAPVSTDHDSRCWVPFLKQAIPDTALNSGDVFNYNLIDYYAAGDVNVTMSPECGDVAPTFTAGGTILPGSTLTQSNKNMATWGGTATGGTASNTYTIKVSNVMDAVTGFTDSIGWSVTNSGPTAIPEGQDKFFVCSNGNNLNTGNTHALPLQTVAGVNGKTFATSSDVYFCEGATFSGTPLVVDWNGTSTDRVVIGTYKLSGGQAFEGMTTAGDTTSLLASSAGTRARFVGNYADSCSSTLSGSGQVCPFESQCSGGTIAPAGKICSANVAGIPSSQYTGMVNINGNYVTVQDLYVANSAGVGISDQSGNNSKWTNALIQRNYMEHLAGGAVNIKWLQYSHVLSNYAYATAVAGNYGDKRYGDHQAGMYNACIQCGWSGYNVFEGNVVRRPYGESMGVYRVSNVAVRGNTFQGGVILVEGSSHVLVEQNTVYGGVTRGLKLSQAMTPGNTGIATTTESFGQVQASSSITDVLVRNNRVANVGGCFNLGKEPIKPGTTEPLFGITWSGNTCVSYSGTAFEGQSSGMTNSNISYLIARNNAFDQPVGGSAVSCGGTVTTATTFDYNGWATTPTSSGCVGSHDVVGDANITGSYNWTVAGISSVPADADWKLVAPTAFDDVGIFDTATVMGLLSVLHPTYQTMVTVPNSIVDTTRGSIDYAGVIRSNPPEMGAYENPLATGKFVDCDAGANGTGTSASPFDSLAHVTGMSTSTDLWIKAGTTCSDSEITVSVSGTATDPVVVGAYYLSGGVAYQNLPTNPTAAPENYTYGTARPIIDGTYEEACSVTLGGSGTCHFEDGSNVPAGGASAGRLNGLVNITGNYVVVQDLQLTNSSGRGVKLTGTHGTVKRNYMYELAHACTGGSTDTYSRIENNYCYKAALAGERADSRMTNWPSGIHFSAMSGVCETPAYGVAVGNTLEQIYGEGIGSYGRPYVVAKRNKVIAAEAVGIYVEHTHDVIIEENQIIGPKRGASAEAAAPGISFGIENKTSCNTAGAAGHQTMDLTNIIARNNLIANTDEGCLLFQMQTPADTDGRQFINNKFVGNTCLGNVKNLVYGSPRANQSTAHSGTVVKSNVFDITSATCTNTPPAANAVQSYNGWKGAASGDCRGTNSVISSSGDYTTAINWQTIGASHSDVLPTIAQWAQGAASVFDNVGAAADTTSISAITAAQNPDYVNGLIQGCPVDTTVRSYDYNCRALPTTNVSDMGALEILP